jgi:RNA polymerase sigma-70 factor (ECF subfamily)
LLKGYLGIAGYDADRSFKGWWFAVLRNCCLDLLRRKKLRPSVQLKHDQELPDPKPDRHSSADLLEALESVAPEHRQILELRYFGGCSYADMAAALSIPVGTVMSRLHAARQALAKVYRRDEA